MKTSSILPANISVIDAHAHSISERNGEHIIGLAGTTHQDSLESLTRYSKNGQVFVGYGMHPWFVNEHCFNNLDENLIPSFDFIGEIGLDRGKKGFNFQMQYQLCFHMLEMAMKYQKSVCLHIVRSYGHMFSLLKKFSQPLYFHGYQGSEEFLSQFPNACIGINVRNFKLKKMQSLYQNISISRILIESDGISNSEEIFSLYQDIAQLKNLEISVLMDIQKANFFHWLQVQP